MNWVSLCIGILIGWIVEWIIDRYYWRRRSNRESMADMALRQPMVSERQLRESQAVVNTQAAELAELRARLAAQADMERRLQECEGDLSSQRAEVERLNAIADLLEQNENLAGIRE